jgi:hypothetical protein
MLRKANLFVFLLVPCLTFFAQDVLTNEAVLKLVKAGLGADMIVTMIKTQTSNFALNTEDIVSLKNGGAPDKVIAAMIVKGSGLVKPGAVDPAPKVEAPLTTKDGIPLPDELGVYRLKDGKYVSIPPEILNLRTARGAQFLVGIMAAAKLNGSVANQHSSTHIAPETDFVVKLPEGTDPAEYLCVKFEVKKDRREVELARGRINMSTGTQKNAVPFESEKLAKQIYRLKFGILKKGEYGLLPPGANISANATSAGKIYTFLVE